MDEQKNCIILYDNKLKKYLDKTNEIQSIYKDTLCNMFLITFSNGKQYAYNPSNVTWLTNPQIIDISDKIFYFNNKRQYSVKAVLKFDNWIKIIYTNNSIRTYAYDNIKIVRDIRNSENVSNLLAYLKEVSSIVDDEGIEEGNFLENELSKIDINENCILSTFLKNTQIQKTESDSFYIFPFSTNKSQIQAVKNALEYNISVIQGPPGTGKTQTILNIIANILIRNKKVAVVSGNNEATRNVQEKLAKVNLSCVSAFLGNSKNIENFFNQPHTYPKFDEKHLVNLDIKILRRDLYYADKIFNCREQLARIEYEISEYVAEKKKNDTLLSDKIISIPKSLKMWKGSSDKILALSAYIEALSMKQHLKIWDRIKLHFTFNLKKCKAILRQANNSVDYLQNKYYFEKLNELSKIKTQLLTFLEKSENKEILANLEQISMSYLMRQLDCYYSSLPEIDFDKNNYRCHFNEFNSRYPVVFSTTHALRYCSGNYLYDYVIIDESSQVDLVSAVIAMSCAQNIIFVGDSKQLSHVIRSCNVQALNDVFKKYSLPKYFDYTRNSILQCALNKYGVNVPMVLLNEHYRCDPQIIEFCNKRFYNGKLHIQTKHQCDNGLKIIVAPSHTTLGRQNQSQAKIIEEEIIPQINCASVGIVAPYRDQVKLISEMVSDNNILIDTVHKFQGKERDVMILSTVSDRVKFYEEEKIDFLNSSNLINVAISRAIKKLYVIVSREILKQDGTLLNELSRYAAYYCGADSIIESKVYSIFELMYDNYAPLLNKFKQRLLNISVNKSENIAATAIKDICSSGKYGSLSFAFNYPLRKIVCSERLLDIEDKRFVENEHTHCDFVIYNVMDKAIRLIVEVDGKQHELEMQKRRDERKDRILSEANIPILRLRTTDVYCEDKIKAALLR